MATSGHEGGRVLIVLGDGDLGAVVYQAVEQASYRPFVVPDAASAEQLIERGLDPCVILFALESPEAGPDFIRRHAAHAATANIPVIFFTPAAAPVGRCHGSSTIVAALVAFVHTYCAPSLGVMGGAAPH